MKRELVGFPFSIVYFLPYDIHYVRSDFAMHLYEIEGFLFYPSFT